jgi:VWFA-related protein
MPTARTVIFVSDGFNRYPGRQLYSILRGFAPKDHIFEAYSRDTEPELENILKLATKYDVKFYTLDSRGAYNSQFNPGNTFDAGTSFSTATQMDSRNGPSEATAATESVDHGDASAARENTDVMAQLAHETGGLFFENSNDLAKGMARAIADTREYYLLAYVSKNDTFDGKYRHITVELNDSKKFRINAKAGYWATEK